MVVGTRNDLQTWKIMQKMKVKKYRQKSAAFSPSTLGAPEFVLSCLLYEVKTMFRGAPHQSTPWAVPEGYAQSQQLRLINNL